VPGTAIPSSKTPAPRELWVGLFPSKRTAISLIPSRAQPAVAGLALSAVPQPGRGNDVRPAPGLPRRGRGGERPQGLGAVAPGPDLLLRIPLFGRTLVNKRATQTNPGDRDEDGKRKKTTRTVATDRNARSRPKRWRSGP